MPSDEAGSTGYDASYVFEFMEPAEYTGKVTFSDGTEHEIMGREGEYADALGNLWDAMIDAGKKAVFDGGGTDVLQEAFVEWIGENLKGVFHYGNGVAGADGRTIRMVTTPGYTIPLLIYMKFAPNTQMPEAEAYAFYLKGRMLFLRRAWRRYR